MYAIQVSLFHWTFEGFLDSGYLRLVRGYMDSFIGERSWWTRG